MLTFQHADLRRLYDYWLRHCPGGAARPLDHPTDRDPAPAGPAPGYPAAGYAAPGDQPAPATAIEPSGLKSPGIKSPAFKSPGGQMPARDDIDPIDLGWMLDRISLFECHPGQGNQPADAVRFRCRVAGTWYSLRFDFEANGSWLDNWPDSAMRNSALALYRLIYADGRPRRVIRQFTIDGVTSMYEGAALPLSDKVHRGVAMIMVGAAPVSDPDMTGLKLIFQAGTYRNWSSE